MGLFTQLEKFDQKLARLCPVGALGMADVNCRSGTGRVVEYGTGSMGGPRGGVILKSTVKLTARYWDSVLTAWRECFANGGGSTTCCGDVSGIRQRLSGH
ncbi:hypothetical protein BANRA_05042 [Escherichia coli]|nr:hypothetical protein BANRA_05042 [Escherichia coli]